MISQTMKVTFTQNESFKCEWSDAESFNVSIGESFIPEYYDGVCEVTPSMATQTLLTQGKVVRENITIKPIPQNYGLITWDGSTITVS